ncbi:hypothetical protein ECCB7326_0872, partial [Escherichia coli CB7326]
MLPKYKTNFSQCLV